MLNNGFKSSVSNPADMTALDNRVWYNVRLGKDDLVHYKFEKNLNSVQTTISLREIEMMYLVYSPTPR
jgi:hypothetical protein